MSDGQTIIKKDSILLSKAQCIFGKDMVKEAYITTYFFPDNELDSKEKMLKRLKNCRVDFGGLYQRIDYGTETIILIFTNGNIIEFSNSDWANISLIKESTFKLCIEEKEKEKELSLPERSTL